MITLTSLFLYSFIAAVVSCIFYDSEVGRKLYYTTSYMKAGILGTGWPFILLLGITIACLVFFLAAVLNAARWIDTRLWSGYRRY